jgi:hypothetical protein
MTALRLRFVVRTLSVALLCTAGAGARAQQVEQVLERQAVWTPGAALELDLLESGATGPDITNYGVTPTSGFSVCQLHPSRGLYCLDERSVRRFANPRDGGPGTVEFSCANPALGLADRPDACSTMAVGHDGSVWISGINGSAYRIIRVVEKLEDGSCPEGAPLTGPSNYCFREYASGQQRMLRLLVVDRGAAQVFDPGTGEPTTGVIGLDQTAAVRFFGPAPGDTPRVLVANRAGWGIGAGSEQVLDLALLQVPNGDEVDNFLLGSTSAGRVRVRQSDVGAPTTPFTAYQSPTTGIGLPGPPWQQCASLPQRFALAASSTANRVYFTDRNFCAVVFLKPSDGNESDGDDAPFNRLIPVRRDGQDLILSTVAYPQSVPANYPPTGATRAPGVIIDLADCDESCVLRRDDEGNPVARLFGVQLSADPSLMLLLQAINVPDCRYLTDDPLCVAADAVIGPPGRPDLQYFDVSKVLPQDITDQFPGLGGPPPQLPPLLIPPSYRGTAEKGYRMGLFFGITEPGTTFVRTFEGEWDVAGLSGSELGCELGYPRFSPLADLLSQDVVLTVSESYITAGGPRGVAPPAEGEPDLRHVATLVNNGCGTTRTGGVRWSAVLYDTEITHYPTEADDQDDVFADLMERLFGELEVTLRDIACRPAVDSDDSLPLAPPACSTLGSRLSASRVNLDRCIGAARNRTPGILQPPASVDYYCSLFLQQFRGFRAELSRIPPGTPEEDPANRIGELDQRATSFEHMFIERFLPSVPQGGFTVP